MINPKTVVDVLSESTTTDTIRFFDSEDVHLLKELWYWCSDKYYNTSECKLHDWQFDLLQEVIQRRDPNWSPPVGSTVSNNRVNLPVWLGSLDKITNKKDWCKWYETTHQLRCSDFIVEHKLDGVSCLVTFDLKNGIKMYTRGNGKVGTDITWVLNWIKYIPPNVRTGKCNKNFMIRGELILKKDMFHQKWSEKYSNARNMVSGLINSKKVPEGIEDICFIAYEWITPSDLQLPVHEQLHKLQKHGWYTVHHFKLPEQWDFNELPVILSRERDNSPWAVDGLVVNIPLPYKRNTDGNPSYSIALKDNSILTQVNTTVKDIEWNISKSRKIKPTVILDPITIDGVTIKRVSGFNAKYITSMNIGKGTILSIVRSGDVIPKILSIVKPTSPTLPEVNYHWDEQGVDIILTNDCATAHQKQFISFFKLLDIKHLGPKTVERLWDKGFRTIEDICNINTDQLTECISSKIIATKISKELEKLNSLPLSMIIGASGKLGNGISIKKIEKLFTNKILYEAFTSISLKPLPTSDKDGIDLIKTCQGFSDKTATLVWENIPSTIQWLKNMNLSEQFINTIDNSQKIEGLWVLSGFRNKTLTSILNTTETVSVKVSGVIVKKIPPNNTEKVKKAIELNIPIIPLETFRRKYCDWVIV